MNTENTSVIKQLQEENTKLVEEAKQLKENLKWNVDEVVRYAHVLEEDYVLRSDDVTEHPDFVDIATDWYERHVWMVDKDEHAEVVAENKELKEEIEKLKETNGKRFDKIKELEKDVIEEHGMSKLVHHQNTELSKLVHHQNTGLLEAVAVATLSDRATKGDPVIYQGKKVDYCEWYTDESEIPEKHRHMFDPCDLCGRLWDRDNLETTYDDTVDDEEEYETEWACYECRPQT